MSFRRVIGVASVLLSTLISASASKTCQEVSSLGSVEIENPLSIAYLQEQSQYWSSSCSSLLPNCILVPSTSSEVSTIVKILLRNTENFAVKAGGHNPNRYYSSISGGPLISLKGLNEVTYDPISSTVKVGPGNRWSAVAKALEPYNVTVVGGRIGHVGVGGYLVGGGLSYLSTQHGWAVDTVTEFEVVLANGTIVTASQTSNADLFNVLRGGGNNFGIVTSYTMKAYPIGQIWGGQMIFSGDQTDQVLQAVRDFTENYPDDKAAIIATNQIALSTLVNIWIIFVFWYGPEPPAGTFSAFTNIGPLLDTSGPNSYYKLLSSFDALVIMGTVYSIATEMSTLPSSEVGHTVMKSYYDHFLNVTMAHKDVPGLSATMALQPLPKRLAQKSKENGGDLLDLDDSVDRILMEFNYSYTFPASDSVMDEAVAALVAGMRSRVKAFIANGTIPDAYLPLFMNDANYQQDYFGRLRPATLSYARGVRDEYDASGFFRDRTGGFKL
ncbi:FAD binding domain-containing protein [Cadophora sp. MPI-SDFR-AT-0126]|nr:FAD binding domain-containing protein [Leotiomycetes sp. MPI-SDFR-AT-0126]